MGAAASLLAEYDESHEALERENARLSDDNQWAWAAGLYEGEGTAYVVHSKRPNRYPKARLKIYMTDEDVVRRFSNIVNCGNVTGPYTRRVGHKDSWAWTLDKWEDVQRVAARLLPYLAKRRTEQLNSVLAAHVSKPRHSETMHTCACGLEVYGNAIGTHRKVCPEALRDTEAK